MASTVLARSGRTFIVTHRFSYSDLRSANIGIGFSKEKAARRRLVVGEIIRARKVGCALLCPTYEFLYRVTDARDRPARDLVAAVVLDRVNCTVFPRPERLEAGRG